MKKGYLVTFVIRKTLFVGLALAAMFVLPACSAGNLQSEEITGNPQPEEMTGSAQTVETTTETPETVTAVGQGAEKATESENETGPESEAIKEEGRPMKMNVQIGSSIFTATLEANPAVDSFTKMMESAPVVIRMSDYSGFEKVGPLGTSLPAGNSQTTTQSGDIVLYNGNQIVIFYGSNSWSYTRLGKIDDLSGWAEALGSGDVTVTFSME